MRWSCCCICTEMGHCGGCNNNIAFTMFIGIGTPVAVQNIIISIGGMAVQMIVNGFGMSFIAGFTATNKLYGILEIAAISYGYENDAERGEPRCSLTMRRIILCG